MLFIIGTLLSNEYTYSYFLFNLGYMLHVFPTELENMTVYFALQLFQNILLLYSSTEVSNSLFSTGNSLLKRLQV